MKKLLLFVLIFNILECILISWMWYDLSTINRSIPEQINNGIQALSMQIGCQLGDVELCILAEE